MPTIERTTSRRGFTMLELLIVMAIVIILISMIIIAIGMANRYSKKAAAITEVKTLATAWEQYHSQYMKWPSFASETTAIGITGTVCRTLLGENIDTNNPRSIQFMSFPRTNWLGNPVNPWGLGVMQKSEYLYFVKFDTDFDGIIRTTSPDLPPFVDVRASVIVWTTNCNEITGTITRTIGSWQ